MLGQEITWEDLAEHSIMGWPVEYTRWARGVGKVPVDIDDTAQGGGIAEQSSDVDAGAL